MGVCRHLRNRSIRPASRGSIYEERGMKMNVKKIRKWHDLPHVWDDKTVQFACDAITYLLKEFSWLKLENKINKLKEEEFYGN
jgi:hypothetical protein